MRFTIFLSILQYHISLFFYFFTFLAAGFWFLFFDGNLDGSGLRRSMSIDCSSLELESFRLGPITDRLVLESIVLKPITDRLWCGGVDPGESMIRLQTSGSPSNGHLWVRAHVADFGGLQGKDTCLIEVWRGGFRLAPQQWWVNCFCNVRFRSHEGLAGFHS